MSAKKRNPFSRSRSRVGISSGGSAQNVSTADLVAGRGAKINTGLASNGSRVEMGVREDSFRAGPSQEFLGSTPGSTTTRSRPRLTRKYSIDTFGTDAYNDVDTYDWCLVFNLKEHDPEDAGCCGCGAGPGETRTAVRERVLDRIRTAGLVVDEHENEHATRLYARIGCTPGRLEAFAEHMRLRVRRRLDEGGFLEAFTRANRTRFREDDGVIFSSAERIRIIKHILEESRSKGGAEIDLSEYVRGNIIKKAFPLPDQGARHALRSRWVMRPCWTQPLDAIRDYLGTKLALYFSFLGFYTSWLIVAAVVGAAAAIPRYLASETADDWTVPAYAVFMMLWATVVMETWKRRSSSLAQRWATSDFHDRERPRVEFEGEPRVGAYVDGTFVNLGARAPGTRTARGKRFVNKHTVPFYPEWKRRCRIACGVPVILTLIGVVMVATFSLLVFRQLMAQKDLIGGQYIAGACNAVSIAILNYVYRFLAVTLTKFENHRTTSLYENSLITKIFLFQWVNAFISLYYLAFFKGSLAPAIAFFLEKAGGSGDASLSGPTGEAAGGIIDTCGDDSCIDDVGIQLFSILVVRAVIGQVKELAIPWLRRMCGRSSDDDGVLTDLERESHKPSNPSTFDEYNEMAIQWGYIVLFSASFPLAPAVALLNNVIEIRGDAWNHLSNYQRPFPAAARDLGSWYTVLHAMSLLAVVTNTALIVFTSTVLDTIIGSDPFTKLFWAVVLEHAILLIKYAIAVFVPDEPLSVKERLAMVEWEEERALERQRRAAAGLNSESSGDSILMV